MILDFKCNVAMGNVTIISNIAGPNPFEKFKMVEEVFSSHIFRKY